MKIKFNRTKTAPVQRQKALTISNLEQFANIFNNGDSSWSVRSQLDQYSKSLYVFAAVNKIAMKISSVDLQLFKIINKDGDSKEVLDHEILDLMSKINPFQTKSEFLRIAWINKKLTGEAFWLKIRNKQGQVVELWNLRPDLMTVVQDDTAYIKHYEFAKYDGGKVIFQREDVIFFKDPDPLNPLRGQSPIGAAKHRVETETQATRFQKEFFKNNARPDALLISTESMGEDQRNQMISDWEEEHGGPEKAGRIGILEGGMKYQQVSISQKEMDFIESLKFTRGDILVALGVPESVIFSNASNFATADSDFRSFLSETIVPELNQLCEVLNEMLVIPDFGEQWYLDFVDPTVEDRASVRADNTAGFGKWLTVNEIRAGLNLPPIDGGDVIQSQDGGQPTVSPTDLAKAQKAAERKKKTLDILKGRRSLKLSFDVGIIMKNELGSIAEMRKKLLKNKTKTKVTAKKKSVQKDEVPSNISIFSSEESRNSYYNLVNKRIDTRSKKFKGKLGELFIKQRNEVLSKLQKFDNKKDINAKIGVGDVAKLLNKNAQIGIFSTVALPFLLDYATQGGKDAARLLGEEFDMSGALRDAIESRSDFFADSVVNTQFQKLVNTLTEGIENEESYTDLTQRVHDIYDDLPDWKAEQVARTETTYATNSGMDAQFNDSQVADGKEWVAVMDVRTRDSHASQNGQIVKLDGIFKNGMRFPGDSSDASEVINCRCVIAPTVGLQKALKGGPGSGGAREGAGRKPGTHVGAAGRIEKIAKVPEKYKNKFNDLLNSIEQKGLPESAIDGLESIEVVSHSQMDKKLVGPRSESPFASVVGLYDKPTKTIYLNNSELQSDVIGIRQARLALVHEIGHHVMESQMSEATQKKIFSIHKAQGSDAINDYAGSNYHERFAVAYGYYYDGDRGRSMVENMEPDLSKIISEHHK